MSKRLPPARKKINPHFWVFCEGETEEAYVSFLRKEYRIPVEVITRISGNNLTQRKINEFKRNKPTHPKDRDFLIYDADVAHVIIQLKKLKKTTLLLSNPCIELWFLLHFKNQNASISKEQCIRELENRTQTEYKKGKLSPKLLKKLRDERHKACERAKSLPPDTNPSSNLFELIKTFEKARKGEL